MDQIASCLSPHTSPAFLLPKWNGKDRLVIEYRQLNKKAFKFSWPILYTVEISLHLERSSFFSSKDMSAGFNRELTERNSGSDSFFSTLFGSFKWKRMPMGFTASANMFQNLMIEVPSGFACETCVPYLDEHIVFIEKRGRAKLPSSREFLMLPSGQS